MRESSLVFKGAASLGMGERTEVEAMIDVRGGREEPDTDTSVELI